MLRKANSSMRLTQTSSACDRGQNSLLRAKATSTVNKTVRSSRPRSLIVVKRAFVRHAACFLFKSKSNFEAEYAYGMSAESTQSSPETTRINPEPLMLRERYATCSACISIGLFLLCCIECNAVGDRKAVCLSACPSHARIVTKRTKVLPTFLYHMKVRSSQFFLTRRLFGRRF